MHITYQPRRLTIVDDIYDTYEIDKVPSADWHILISVIAKMIGYSSMHTLVT